MITFDRTAVSIELARLGWTQTHLADRMGMSGANLSGRLGKGEMMRLRDIEEIAAALGVPARSLLVEDEAAYPQVAE